MTAQTRKLLDQIDDVLEKQDPTSKEVWLVLTALRGNDHGDGSVKAHSTAPIRTAAFPKTAAKGIPFRHRNGSGQNVDLLVGQSYVPGVGLKPLFSKPRQNVNPAYVLMAMRQDAGSHFANHVWAAAEVLGILK